MTEQDAQPPVVLVEDEPRLRKTLSRAIEQMGFVCEAHGSAESALKAWPPPEGPPCIVVTDLNLPHMAGLELLTKLRDQADAAQVAFVVLTGFGDLPAAQQAIDLNVVAFLTKPCPLGDLEAALDKAWRRIATGPHEKQTSLPEAEASDSQSSVTDEAADLSLVELERRHILEAVTRHGGNRQAAAEELGISVRKLYYRLAEYGET